MILNFICTVISTCNSNCPRHFIALVFFHYALCWTLALCFLDSLGSKNSSPGFSVATFPFWAKGASCLALHTHTTSLAHICHTLSYILVLLVHSRHREGKEKSGGKRKFLKEKVSVLWDQHPLGLFYFCIYNCSNNSCLLSFGKASVKTGNSLSWYFWGQLIHFYGIGSLIGITKTQEGHLSAIPEQLPDEGRDLGCHCQGLNSSSPGLKVTALSLE